MGKVSLDINGRKYAMGCEDGEEERLLRLGQKLDDRVAQMANQFGQIGDLRLLVMAGITMMDEVEDTMENLDLRVDARAAGLRKERDAATLASAKSQAEAAKALNAAAKRIEWVGREIERVDSVWSYLRLSLVLFLTGLLLGCVKAAGPDLYLIEGRYLQTGEEIRLSYPGSRFRIASNGNNLVIYITATRPDLMLDMRVENDAWEMIVLSEGKNEIFPFDSLRIDDPSTHRWQIDLMRRNEAWQGDVIVTGTDSYGILVPPTPFPKTKLLFIGDSITAGAGTTSRLNENGDREAVSNARLAYPRVLGDRLNAQVHHVAYGGRGLTRDWQGITDTNNAPQFYDRVMPDSPEHLWDPQDYQADIISVMLGTNDFNLGIPDRESWTQAYADFVTRIRSDYPKAQVFLISSPMTGGEKGEVLKAYVKEVADGFGTPWVQYLEVGQYYGEAWDSHPTAAEHQKIADELEADFRGALSK